MQSSVGNYFQASGIPGEFSRSGIQRAFGAKLNSDTETLNVASSVVMRVDGDDNQVGVAQDGNFAGILSTPKAQSRPTLTALAYIENESQVEVATAGYLWVTLATTGSIGDFVYYSDTDGTLSSFAPDTAPDAGYTRLAGGTIVGDNVTVAGTAEIYFDAAGSVETPASE